MSELGLQRWNPGSAGILPAWASHGFVPARCRRSRTGRQDGGAPSDAGKMPALPGQRSALPALSKSFSNRDAPTHTARKFPVGQALRVDIVALRIFVILLYNVAGF